MKTRWIIAAASLLAGASSAAGQNAGMDAETGWKAITACAAHRAAEDRRNCTDQVLRDAGVLDPVQEAQVQREQFGRTARAEQAPPPAMPAPAPAPAPAQAVPPAPSAPPPQKLAGISTTVAAARISADGKLLVATAEASVWRQADGETFRIPPQKGAMFEVETGALGSFMCKVGGGRTYRCVRVD